MVIPSSSSRVVNMRFMFKTLMLSSSILVSLSSTAYSSYVLDPKTHIKSATFVSGKFEMRPGSVVETQLIDIDFPRGHVGIKSFDAELIDEEGNPVPLYETYLHHWFALRYFDDPKSTKSLLERAIFVRNQGTCQGPVLPHYWGFGGESRGTTSNIPDPFAIEVGNPAKLPNGFEDKWFFNIMAIDTRGVQDRKGCSECRCDLMNITKNFFSTAKDVDGKPLNPDYKGGIFCCTDKLQCKLREGFQAPTRRLALRYKIRWVDWDKFQVPVKVYILDSTDKVMSNGSKTIHGCKVEYTIPENGNNNSPHVQKTNIPMEKGGYLIYGVAHMHSGVVNATLYGKDGRTLCTSTPKYGTGKEAGNEEGYAVGMSVCYPQPGTVKINDGETLTIESIYKNEFTTGAMGLFYIYLAERLSQDA
ncbi:uncharacterized protein LOC133294079 [Gastrolobium bilobum]|uniref:uncharacterized protein LOC133290548 n=1 Tax=Gastrolobium bilobum TaxID=150636 RepID=UPI002AB192AE|nr:uncharacterized protein LOC133290548 [Gastrolobium bilobum]XP_061344630.1 uncharacterized protein LOC133290549 [Gastrolobium bilobum]XP_061348720.1 uncharacterized protein LOC133294079 [Gastrolobium bilobum]